MAAERVLVVSLADLGDLVLATPALAALRGAFPRARVTVLTTPHAAPALPPGLHDALLTFPKQAFDQPRALLRPAGLRALIQLSLQVRAGRYDAVLLLHHVSSRGGALKYAALLAAAGARWRGGLAGPHTGRLRLNVPVADAGFGAQHQAAYGLLLVQALAHAAGGTAPPRPFDAATHPSHVHTPPADVAWARAHLPPPGRAPLVALHAGSGGYATARRWEPACFAEVGAALAAERGAALVLVGGPSDDTPALAAALAQRGLPFTDLGGRTTLGQLAAVLARAQLVVGADSGVLHVAAAAGAPVVALFGPSNADAWGPWAARSAVVRQGVLCSPCSYVGVGVGLRDGCPARTCLRALPPQPALDAARALLDGATPPAPPPQIGLRAGPGRVFVLGCPVDALDWAAWLDAVQGHVEDGPPHSGATRLAHICTLNPEFVMIARRDANFRHILRRAAIVTADGVGILWAARWQGVRLPGRVTGSDGVPRLAERAAARGWRVFLLGAAPGIADRAAAVLAARFPGLQVVGTASGSPHADDEDALVALVHASRAQVLLVAYGAPSQDAWIARNAVRLPRVRVAMGVGGALDYVAGVVPLAPGWMRRAGLEWLFRLVRQPWRARRMTRLPRFVWAVVRRGRHQAAHVEGGWA